MGRPIEPDNEQLRLISRDPEEWVDKSHMARFINELVNNIPMEEMGFMDPASAEGGSYYPAKTLLKAFLYGYIKRIRTLRELEDACRNRLDFMWLIGERAPDHNTLWRFMTKHREGLEKLFTSSVRIAVGHGIIRTKLHGVDGTKIQAKCSYRSAWMRGKLERKLERIDEEVKGYMDGMMNSDDGESFSLPEALQEQEVLRAEIRKALSELDLMERDYMNPHEREARMMKTESGKDFAYNAQVVVDESSGMVVAADVVNDETDKSLLVPMLEKARENVGESCDETVADSGYASGEQLLMAEEKGFSTIVDLGDYINPPDDEKHRFHTSKFKYDEAKDEFICPRGERLIFGREMIREDRGRIRIYRCGCYRDCPERPLCVKGKGARIIEYGMKQAAVRRQIEKQKDPSVKKALRSRFCFVERIFAYLKQHMRFRRWTLSGITRTRAQWKLMCAAYNFVKLYKLWVDGKFSFADLPLKTVIASQSG